MRRGPVPGDRSVRRPVPLAERRGSTRRRSRTPRRPTRPSGPPTPFRSPAEVRGELNGQELPLYRLIWQRTLASQMADADGHHGQRAPRRDVVDGRRTTRVRRHRHHDHVPRLPPGLRRGSRRARRASAPTEERCCRRSPSDNVVPGRRRSTPNGHTTTPPARYTEASLVKRLEELGIGRPSTWASIIQTIQDRGYVWKKGQALVPTWTAFAVVNLLEQHFDDARRLRLHRPDGGRPRRDRPQRGPEGGVADALLLRRRATLPGPEAARRGEPRRDRRRGDQHVPARPRRSDGKPRSS